ncbi:MAG: S41 family peptidase [Bacteroidales bacterium]|nr:S41 family peptidase [Bacteroidales bacterium]
MRYKKLWSPIILGIAVIVGIFLGRLSTPKQQADDYEGVQVMQMPTSTNKLQQILDAVELYYVDNVSTDSILEKVIPQVLEDLDPHTTYIPADLLNDVNSELKSNFGGVGVQFAIIQDTVNIVAVVNGGPSSHLGVLPGDRIIKVNNEPFVGPSITNQMVIDSLRGDIGTTVDITVFRAGTNIDFRITRGLIPQYSVNASYMLTDSIGYISIDRFAENTYEEMLQGIAKLKTQGCTKLVVDLRSNQGGLLDVVIRMCNEFLGARDLIVYTEGAHQVRQEARADGRGVCQDMEVVTLIDEFSASASEIFAGAMQDNDRGLVIGRRSFGKGLVQTQLQLPDLSALRLTISRYHTPSGRCIQRPYSDGREDYYQEMGRRFANELFKVDSTKMDLEHKYSTKNGRTVFGGGGIIPDIFIPHDTTKASVFLYNLRAKTVLYSYSLEYANKHRDEYKGMSTKSVVEALKQKSLWTDVLNYAASKGISPKGKINPVEKNIIEQDVRAYIAKDISGNDAFYAILNETDPAILKAIESMEGK